MYELAIFVLLWTYSFWLKFCTLCSLWDMDTLFLNVKACMKNIFSQNVKLLPTRTTLSVRSWHVALIWSLPLCKCDFQRKKKIATTELDITFLEAIKTLLQQTFFNKAPAIPETTKGKDCGGIPGLWGKGFV